LLCVLPAWKEGLQEKVTIRLFNKWNTDCVTFNIDSKNLLIIIFLNIRMINNIKEMFSSSAVTHSS